MVGENKVSAQTDVATDTYTRADRLTVMLDHCKAAKKEADELDEKFLAYLLAMAIQEGQSRMPGKR